MREVKVAIVSKRRELARFLELEALNFDFKVSIFDKLAIDLGDFDLLIVDTMATRQLPTLFDGRMLIVTDGESKASKEGECLVYPIPIDALRYVYEQVAYGESAPKTTLRHESVDACIFFYRSSKNTVGYCGRSITLSDHEMKILTRLCENAREPVSREELNALLGASSGNIADVYVCRLRKKLEEIDGRRVIFTVRSKGYMTTLDMELK